MELPNAPHFSAVRVGAYRIRPTKWPRRGQRVVRSINFQGYSFHKWNVWWAYAIHPYRVTRKRIDFLRSNVGAYCIRPTGRHPKDGKCAKHDTFSGYNDRIIWKRITFSGYSFHRWNVLGAYAIRPYRVTRKRVDFFGFHVGAYCIHPTGRHLKDGEYIKRVNFFRYNDRIIPKRITFWIFIFDEWWKRGSFSGYIDLVV